MSLRYLGLLTRPSATVKSAYGSGGTLPSDVKVPRYSSYRLVLRGGAGTRAAD